MIGIASRMEKSLLNVKKALGRGDVSVEFFKGYEAAVDRLLSITETELDTMVSSMEEEVAVNVAAR